MLAGSLMVHKGFPSTIAQGKLAQPDNSDRGLAGFSRGINRIRGECGLLHFYSGWNIAASLRDPSLPLRMTKMRFFPTDF